MKRYTSPTIKAAMVTRRSLSASHESGSSLAHCIAAEAARAALSGSPFMCSPSREYLQSRQRPPTVCDARSATSQNMPFRQSPWPLYDVQTGMVISVVKQHMMKTSSRPMTTETHGAYMAIIGDTPGSVANHIDHECRPLNQGAGHGPTGHSARKAVSGVLVIFSK